MAFGSLKLYFKLFNWLLE